MKFYAVAKGRKVGIFKEWSECQEHVKGFSGPIYKSFQTEQAAKDFLTINGIPGYLSEEQNKKRTPEDLKKDTVFLLIHDKNFCLDECNRERALHNNDQTSNIPGLIKLYFDEKTGHIGVNGVTILKWNNEILKVHFASDKDKQPLKKKKPSNDCIKIFTDGGCKGNGTDSARAGIGIYFEGGEYENVSKRIHGKQTNNRGELTAILEALKIVKPEENVIIHTDSEYAIKGIKKINKRNLNVDLFDEIDSVLAKRTGKFELEKVQGHSGSDDGNARADELATKACKLD